MGEIVRYSPEKKNKISAASETVDTARITPKICTHGAPDVIQIGSLSAKL